MKDKVIGVIGNGFVGSALAAAFSDTNEIRVYDTSPKQCLHSWDEVLHDSDFIFVAVPTPMTHRLGGEIDLTIVHNVFERIRETPNKKDSIIILKSSVVPGSAENIEKRFPSQRMVYSPEFLREKTARLDVRNPSRIVLGGNEQNVNEAKKLFQFRFPAARVLTTDLCTAQMIKYMSNCFLATKVAYMNEMRQAADKLNVNWEDALIGLSMDGRIGLSHLDAPGPDGDYGFGGKCFPKDINAFIHMFDSLGIDATVMKAAWKKNLEVRNNYDWTDIKGAVSEPV